MREGTYQVILRFGRSVLQAGKNGSSSWKPFSPLPQTLSVIQANSRSRCVFLVRNLTHTHTYLSKDPIHCAANPPSLFWLVGPKECRLTPLMEPSLNKTRRGFQGHRECALSRLIAMEVPMSLPSPRVKLLQTTIYLSDSGFLTYLPRNTRNFSSNYLSMLYTIGLNISVESDSTYYINCSKGYRCPKTDNTKILVTVL